MQNIPNEPIAPVVLDMTSEEIDSRAGGWLQRIASVNRRDWRPVPKQSALLVIDCQNFFVSSPQPTGAGILRNVRRLCDLFRKAGRPVIFTRHMHKKDLSDTGMLGEWWAGAIIEGTWDSELHPALGADPNDIVIPKNRYSAFQGTDLQRILDERKVRDLVVTGVMTNLCCETTSRDAFMRDFRVFFVADATATASEEMHIATLLNAAFGFAVVLKSNDVAAVF